MAILTIDLGTTNTKAAVWDEDGLIAIGRAGIVTSHPAVGHAEQDANLWWPSVVRACAAASRDSAVFGDVEAIGFSGARQTFVPTTVEGLPTGPALLWSDRRGGGGVAANVAWLRDHEPARLAAARWLLGPRDLMVRRMTGEVATDWSHSSATDVSLVAGEMLPTPVAPTTIVGALLPGPAAELGLRPGLPIMIGAGDRQCEVLGSGATTARPMVSWGTTANISVPVDALPDPPPDGIVVTRAATSGWLLEGGVSAAGSLVAWLSGLVGLDVLDLWGRAAASPAGARGVIALPWLGGARAPWWNDRAGAALLGLSPAHDAGDLARAAVEAVGWEIDRCLTATGIFPDGLACSGAGPLWTEVLTSITGLPAYQRRSGESASAGAALLTALALGRSWDLSVLNPVVSSTEPDAALVASYVRLRPAVERAAEAVIGLARD